MSRGYAADAKALDEMRRPKFSSKYLIQHVSQKLIPAVKEWEKSYQARPWLRGCGGAIFVCMRPRRAVFSGLSAAEGAATATSPNCTATDAPHAPPDPPSSRPAAARHPPRPRAVRG